MDDSMRRSLKDRFKSRLVHKHFHGLIRLWIWFATGRAISIGDPDPADVLDGTFDPPNAGGWAGGPSLPDIDLDRSWPSCFAADS